MRYKHPIRQILTATRSYWDQADTRPAVRRSFDMITKCGTLALGAEVFSSGTEEKLVPHTCKVRPCPSCGHRQTVQWQREQWCALPDIRYAGIVFTMPSELWPIFQRNRHLLHDLPSLGAEVIRQWVNLTYGIRVLTMVIPHNFGSQLNFNCHLHLLVSASGLDQSRGRWVERISFNSQKLMHMWRFAVISFLRAALRARVITYRLSDRGMRALLAEQYRWWSVKLDHFTSKEHFLKYAARYVRRPPIAQYRIQSITDTTVQFRCKFKHDGKKTWIDRTCSLEKFVDLLGEQVPDRYQHAIRRFGLLAPRAKAVTSAAVLALLNQRRRPSPRRLGWAFSIRRDFGVNPLQDSQGRAMYWAGRLSPRR